MSRILIACCLLLAMVRPLSAEDGLAAEMKDFMASRRVLGAVRFDEGSSTLSGAARSQLDRLVPRLRGVDHRQFVIRIEGFASAGGSEQINVPLSMLRAKAVIDYMQNRHNVAQTLFLTGYGSEKSEFLSVDPECVAEIALYDNPWDMSSAPVEKMILQ